MDVLPISAPLTVPSQSWSGQIAGGECTRCGHPTEPGNGLWNVCPSCAAIAVGGPSSVNLQHPTANCAACRVALRVPSHYQTAHVLCPPCQARHAAIIKPKPQDHAVPRRANPYPVVTPIPKSARAVALTVAYTYPHLPAPSTTSSSLQSVGADASRGVYTSASHRGDVFSMCEAYAGAEFVRPPPATTPKRVPRRATERTFPYPRESLDLVRASLVRKAAHGAAVTTERKNVENELEVDLVYPDDIPVATQYASTASESKEEEPGPIEDEDVELELVYPEDTAETTQTSSSKPRTKVSPPTTLRELFTNGLQTLPTLQDLTALADKSPPRRCRMPGCNEALLAQTCMERCVTCSIGDWKRRKLTSMDTSDPSRRLSTSSLTTNTSMEEKEVTTMLDEISHVEDESDLSPLTSSSNSSSDGLTGDHGVRPIPGWDSDLTELSSSDSESESISDSDSDPDPGLARPHGDTTGLTIRIPLLVNRLPPDGLFRKCGNKRCNIALPKDHRWKTCDPCRRAQRMYQRMRLGNKRRSILGIEMLESPDLPCRQWCSLSPAMRETDTTLTPETSRPCSARNCRSRIPLPEVYRWKTCIGCRARARREARRKRDALVETQHASCQPEVVPRFTAYQNRGVLSSSFDAQLKGFVEGQIMYLRAKLHESEARGQAGSESRKPKHAPMIFVFVGEYSIVTGQRGDSERDSQDRDDLRTPCDPAELEAMRQEVSSIVLDLERALRTKFSAGEAFALDKGGMIMRFMCSLELIAQLRPLTTIVGLGSGPSSASDSEASARKDNDNDNDNDASREDVPPTLKPPPHPPAVPLVKTLSGELEAVVVPDESHRLFQGRRMVIRYSMLG